MSGIGNAYSDEILHLARLSPAKRTAQISDDNLHTLFDATRETLLTWREQLLEQCGEEGPEKGAAFRLEMAVHGRFGEPCPACGVKVQRIVYAENDSNYCPGCQTEGRLLADRALSRLLKQKMAKTRRRAGKLSTPAFKNHNHFCPSIRYP